MKVFDILREKKGSNARDGEDNKYGSTFYANKNLSHGMTWELLESWGLWKLPRVYNPIMINYWL
jgi:hypothetical protein